MNIITDITKVLTSSRFKSFYWRTGMMFLAGFVDLVIENLGGSGMSPQVIVVLGLVLGEVSKAINNIVQERKALEQ